MGPAPHASSPAQAIGSVRPTSAVGAKTVAGTPRRWSTGSATSRTDRKASSNVTATVRAAGGSSTALVKVTGS